MAEAQVVKFAKIISREKLPERLLFCGTYKPDDSKKQILGQIFYFIEIVAPYFPNPQIPQQIISSFSESFYLQSSLDSALNLENALKQVNAKVADLVTNSDSDWLNNLNAVLGVVKEDEIHFSQVGSLAGFLFREGHASQITENQSLKKDVSPLKTFEQLISGNTSPGDRILITNNQLLNHLSIERLRICLSADQVELGLEEIYRHLKKVKAKEIDALAFEVNTVKHFSETTLTGCPDTFYLDLPIDSQIQHYKKKAQPYLDKAKSLSVAGYGHAKKGALALHKAYKERLAPKIKSAAVKSKEVAALSYKSANDKLLPKLGELKDSKPISGIRSAAGGYIKKGNGWLAKVGRFLGPYFKSLKFLWLPQNRKYVYVCLAVLIISFAYIKVRANNLKQVDVKKQQEIVAALDAAKLKFETAKTDLGLKRTEQGIAELVEAQGLATTAGQSDINKAEATTLLEQINLKLDEQIKATRLKASDIFLSLEQYPSSQVLYTNNFLYYLSQTGQVISLNVKTKDQKVLGTIPTGSGNLKAATMSSDSTTIHMLTDTYRVFSCKLADGSVTEQLITGGSGKWETSASISEFGGNIYLYDPEAGIVWKHTLVTGGYSKGKDYLDTSKVSIKGGKDMAINGDVYILLADGSLKKFSKGILDETFSIRGIPTPDATIKNPSRVITVDGQTGDLLVLDKDKNRIIRYNKNGDFQHQYISDLGAIKSATVNAKTLRAWVLVDNKVYEIGL